MRENCAYAHDFRSVFLGAAHPDFLKFTAWDTPHGAVGVRRPRLILAGAKD
jgi:hypothetical protein